MKLMELALRHVPPVRMLEISRRLCIGGEPVAPDEETVSLVQLFSADLALFTAPPGRSSAVERLAKQLRPPPNSVDGQALTGLVKARFALFELTGPVEGGILPARDLLSGQQLLVEDETLSAQSSLNGRRFGARLVPVGERVVIAGAAIPVDATMLELLRPSQTRDGRGWSNPVRAAETLYRHALRYGLELLAEPDRAPEAFPHSPQDGPLHALAHAWSALPEGAAPPAEQERQARTLSTQGDHVLDALSAAVRARFLGRFALAAGYERVLALMLDTLQRRAAIGQSGSIGVLEWAERELAHGSVPPEVRALFQRLRSRVAPTEDAGLDRLRGRIRALRAKTVDQGCTEEEALAAAEKVADLLDRYGLSLSELDLRHQPCDGFGIETGRKRGAPLDDIVPAIAEFCDCRSWMELTPDKMIRHVFFGLPADIAGARYLYEVVAATVESETARFRADDLYQGHHPSQRANASRSFQVGMVHSIAGKLYQLKQQRDTCIRSAHGRDLVPIKHGVIDEELEKLGISFQSKLKRASRVLSDAYHAGREAGEAFEVHPGLEGRGRAKS